MSGSEALKSINGEIESVSRELEQNQNEKKKLDEQRSQGRITAQEVDYSIVLIAQRKQLETRLKKLRQDKENVIAAMKIANNGDEEEELKLKQELESEDLAKKLSRHVHFKAEPEVKAQPKVEVEQDADFALALRMQDEENAKGKKQKKPISKSASERIIVAPPVVQSPPPAYVDNKSACSQDQVLSDADFAIALKLQDEENLKAQKAAAAAKARHHNMGANNQPVVVYYARTPAVRCYSTRRC
jgi:hypothetical protein